MTPGLSYCLQNPYIIELLAKKSDKESHYHLQSKSPEFTTLIDNLVCGNVVFHLYISDAAFILAYLSENCIMTGMYYTDVKTQGSRYGPC